MVIVQSIAGVRPAWDFTVPLPTPGVPLAMATVNGPLRNRACAVRSAFMVTLQAPVPEQAPYHCTNEWPLFGTAVRVTTTPSPN